MLKGSLYRELQRESETFFPFLELHRYILTTPAEVRRAGRPLKDRYKKEFEKLSKEFERNFKSRGHRNGDFFTEYAGRFKALNEKWREVAAEEKRKRRTLEKLV